MTNLSIRLRLTLWYSAVLLLGLSLFAAGLWVSLEHRLLTQVDVRLQQRVDGLRTVLDIGGGTDRKETVEELTEFAHAIPEGPSISLSDDSGPLLSPGKDEYSAAAGIPSDAPAYATRTHHGRLIRILAGRIQQGGRNYNVSVASSLEEVETVMEDFRNLLLLMIPGVLVMACCGGYWISRRALAPVDEITRVARSISLQNLSNRLPVPATGDELQRMSEAWNDVLHRLDGAVSRIRQFTADASHELRTPLAFIRATAELALRRERSATEYQRFLGDIQTESDRLTELAESLLMLARADDGGAMPLAPTDLNDVVRDVVHQSEPAAGVKGIGVRTELTETPAIADANLSAIRRLLITLVDNALKNTPAGGTVTISTTPAENGIVLSVEDTGQGIAPEALPHIFERFFRADSARGSGNGTGLGLSIAQSIAKAHGSQVSVSSEPGAGARFALLLRRN